MFGNQFRKIWIIANPKNTSAALGKCLDQKVTTVRQQSTGSSLFDNQLQQFHTLQAIKVQTCAAYMRVLMLQAACLPCLACLKLPNAIQDINKVAMDLIVLKDNNKVITLLHYMAYT